MFQKRVVFIFKRQACVDTWVSSKHIVFLKMAANKHYGIHIGRQPTDLCEQGFPTTDKKQWTNLIKASQCSSASSTGTKYNKATGIICKGLSSSTHSRTLTWKLMRRCLPTHTTSHCPPKQVSQQESQKGVEGGQTRHRRTEQWQQGQSEGRI